MATSRLRDHKTLHCKATMLCSAKSTAARLTGTGMAAERAEVRSCGSRREVAPVVAGAAEPLVQIRREHAQVGPQARELGQDLSGRQVRPAPSAALAALLCRGLAEHVGPGRVCHGRNTSQLRTRGTGTTRGDFCVWAATLGTAEGDGEPPGRL